MRWVWPPIPRAAGTYPADMDDEGRRVEMDAKRGRFAWTLVVAVVLWAVILGACVWFGACR